ncbi:LysE type translocator [Paracidovorax cattleyae]|uniref:LysE type translocator n=1 Tax=Paracidovorax cattleyae TaxID=80868 RepID=A0A1H0VJ70_9BURK|nr:LysE type translocator [Paracidovorax cattleyae]
MHQPGLQQRMRVLLVVHHQFQGDALALQGGCQRRQEPGGQRIRIHGQHDGRKRRAPAIASQVGQQLALHGPRGAAGPTTHQQRLAEPGFQRAHPERYRRRREVQRGARLGDGPGTARARRTGTRQALAAVLAVSLLNPHMVLDTVVLLGALGGQRPPPERVAFAAGTIAASTAWFLSLGFGARLLSPWFARPSAWRALDAFVAAVMLSLAAFLAFTPLPTAP